MLEHIKSSRNHRSSLVGIVAFAAAFSFALASTRRALRAALRIMRIREYILMWEG